MQKLNNVCQIWNENQKQKSNHFGWHVQIWLNDRFFANSKCWPIILRIARSNFSPEISNFVQFFFLSKFDIVLFIVSIRNASKTSRFSRRFIVLCQAQFDCSMIIVIVIAGYNLFFFFADCPGWMVLVFVVCTPPKSRYYVQTCMLYLSHDV